MFANICLISFVNLLYWEEAITQKIFPIVSDLEPLLLTQERIIKELKDIVSRKRETIDYIEKEIERFENVHEKIETENKYLENPLNTFTLQKRITFDFEFIQNATQQDTAVLKSEELKYPSGKDLKRAGRVITHLHVVYKLNATQVADGLLAAGFSESGEIIKEYFLPMTASDCFEVSAIAKGEKKRISPKVRLLWLLEALRIFTRGGFDYGFNKFDLVNGICECYEALGDTENYIKWAHKLLDMRPNYNGRNLRQKIRKLENELRNSITNETKPANVIENIVIEPRKELTPCVEGLDRHVFKLLCRGEVKPPSEVSIKLKCWYDKGRHPFTRLAPFKAELLYSKPDIILFHDVISDKEIDIIKRRALPQLDITESMAYRFCKGMQIRENETAGLEQVGQRMSDFTGGLAAPVEMMSVSNYGVGGFYVTHVDSMTKLSNDNAFEWRQFVNQNVFTEENVNDMIAISKQFYRLATVLFYMSDVEQGGATVFPVLGLTVFPVKGAALFWNNMHPSLAIDYTTCHGACPVLRGSKWVVTRWISAENQELNKPCTDKFTSREIEDVPFPELKQ